MLTHGFVKGDLDGFFGLFVDNLLQLMVIVALGTAVCGFDIGLIQGKILTGAAISVLAGNLFYAWQARELARRTGRSDVTALPYGINTPTVVAFIFLIMGPIYQETKDANLAWRAGLFACFMSGVIEIIGAFTGDWLRRHTPRAALLSALSGIGIAFIAMGFVFQIFANPLLALFPALLIIFFYASGFKLPLAMPSGLFAVILGTIIAWVLRACGWALFTIPSTDTTLQLHFFSPCFGDVLSFFMSPVGWKYMPVIIPLSLFTVIGSLQNLESAEAAGDRFETRPSLLVNGLGTLCAACFGSAFPTTIYIGHPGWKAMGARWGYSVLNGLAITVICLTGSLPFIMKYVPLDVTLGILLWIGLIITAQAFQTTPPRHAMAVVLGLIPVLAGWGLLLIETALRKAGTSLFETAPKFTPDIYIYGIIALSQGFILTSMILAAIMAHVLDGAYKKAAAWTAAAALLSAIGIIHAYTLTPAGIQNKFGWMAAPHFVLSYAMVAVMLMVLHFKRGAGTQPNNSSSH